MQIYKYLLIGMMISCTPKKDQPKPDTAATSTATFTALGWEKVDSISIKDGQPIVTSNWRRNAGITHCFATCEIGHIYWEARSDGYCYIEDMPKVEVK